MTKYSTSNSCLNKQHGVSLTIVLILLLIMTLLGLASMRGALMQERMSANQFDRSLGFQAAETGLRTAEARLQTPPAESLFTAACSTGLCATPVAGSIDRWNNAATVWTSVAASGTNPPSRYIIEDMGRTEIPNPLQVGVIGSPTASFPYRIFRITSESQGVGRSRILLQSNYSTP